MTFKIDKTNSGIVAMSTHHLFNDKLTLKSKGLHSVMLALPENFLYTTQHLAEYCNNSVDTVRVAVRELEKLGYLTRERVRDENGKFSGIEYIIHERPTA
jgi:predicted transcriptional regulator